MRLLRRAILGKLGATGQNSAVNQDHRDKHSPPHPLQEKNQGPRPHTCIFLSFTLKKVLIESVQPNAASAPPPEIVSQIKTEKKKGALNNRVQILKKPFDSEKKFFPSQTEIHRHRNGKQPHGDNGGDILIIIILLSSSAARRSRAQLSPGSLWNGFMDEQWTCPC